MQCDAVFPAGPVIPDRDVDGKRERIEQQHDEHEYEPRQRHQHRANRSAGYSKRVGQLSGSDEFAAAGHDGGIRRLGLCLKKKGPAFGRGPFGLLSRFRI